MIVSVYENEPIPLPSLSQLSQRQRHQTKLVSTTNTLYDVLKYILLNLENYRETKETCMTITCKFSVSKTWRKICHAQHESTAIYTAALKHMPSSCGFSCSDVHDH